VFQSFEENETVYCIEDYVDGENFEKKEITSLSSALYATLLLAELIRKYHENGYLYVDISPKNVIYIEEGSAKSIRLFDFDTVRKKDEIYKSGKIVGCTYDSKNRSDYYASPEVVNCINGIGSIKNVDEKSDLYSIIAILFSKVMGRAPDSTIDGTRITRWNYENNTLVKECPPEIEKQLSKIFRKSLASRKENRWDIEKLINNIKKAIEICEAKEWIADQNIRVTTEYYIERKDKEKEIKKALKGKNIVFICGVSGYGKSELARSYCENNRNLYSTVNLIPYDTNLMKTIASIEVNSNKLDLHKSMTDKEKCERNLKLIRASGGNLLLIIDNANTNLFSNENMKVFRELRLIDNFDIIITTNKPVTQDAIKIEISAQDYCTKELIDMFSSISKQSYNEAYVVKLVELLSYSPKLIYLAAKCVVDKNENITSLIERLDYESPEELNNVLSNKSIRFRENQMTFGESSELYFPQSLFINDKAILSTELKKGCVDLSFLKENRLILVTAPGGQGKSFFAKKIVELKHRQFQFDDVFLISLSILVNKNLLDSNQENIILESIPSLDNNENVLIILDGFNEYISNKNPSRIEKISDSISDLAKKYKHISVVITSRNFIATKNSYDLLKDFDETKLSGTPQKIYSTLKAKYEKICPFYLNDNKLSEVGNLAKIPMYAILLSELIDSIDKAYIDVNNKYQLMESAFSIRCNQRIGLGRDLKDINRNNYIFYYFVFLPRLAFDLAKRHNYFFNKTDIRRVLDDISSSSAFSENIYKYECEKKNYNSEITFPNDVEELIKYIQEDGELIIRRDDSYEYVHEDWRNFLSAMYTVQKINYFESNVNTDAIEVIHSLKLDLNVDSNIASSILQGLGFTTYGIQKDFEDKNKEHFYSRFEKTFQKLQTQAEINYTLLKLLNLYFDICDYLQCPLPIDDDDKNCALHEVLSILTRKIEIIPDYIADNTNFKTDDIKSESIIFICEILAKESEYYRRDRNFEKVDALVKVCNSIKNNDLTIINQKAKMYLCYAQSIFLNEKDKYNVVAPKCVLDSCLAADDLARELFDKGKELLRKNAKQGSNFSTNLHGLLLTTPAPFLLIKDVIHPNYKEAFMNYLNIVYSTKHKGRNSAYTIRQILNLIVFGNISISPDFEHYRYGNALEENILSLYDNLIEDRAPCLTIDPHTLLFAEDLLKKADGQELSGLNYIRGCIALSSGDREKAELFFKSPLKKEYKLLYKIRLKYVFGEENSDDIKKCYDELLSKASQNTNGLVDKTHPVYYYLEAKSLEINYLIKPEKKDELESKKEFFNDFEKKKGIKELCKQITSAFQAKQ
jgi:serine/threonine protein kinase